jgi:hypothetical protein
VSQNVPDHLLLPLGLVTNVDRSDRPWGRPLAAGEFGPDESIGADLDTRSMLRLWLQDNSAYKIARRAECWEPCFYQEPVDGEVKCRLLFQLCWSREQLIRRACAAFDLWVESGCKLEDETNDDGSSETGTEEGSLD